MKIFLTGGSGFIGRHFTKMADSMEIFNYDLENGNDIRDKFMLDKAVQDFSPDFVIHMAARAGVSNGEAYSSEYISTNVQGTQNVVDVCVKYQVPLIFFSSSSVLGGNKLLNYDPTKSYNEMFEDLNEKSLTSPKSLYGITKLAGEFMVKNAKLPRKLIIRPFTVYGENGRRDMVIYKMIEAIKAHKMLYFDEFTLHDRHSGEDVKLPLLRGYTYVGDLVSAILNYIKGSSKEILEQEVIHIGGSDIVSTNDLFSILSLHCYKRKIEFRYEKRIADSYNINVSFTNAHKAKELLNFTSSDFTKNLKRILNREL
jgi:UDP-glucuronate 4-epimerase